MACFLVSAGEAAVVSIVKKSVEKKEASGKEHSKKEGAAKEISLSTKLHWLSSLLLGGAVLLAFEHVWHGEVVPWFPFLTAMSDPGDAAEMLQEMGTVGVGMAALITAVWAVMCKAADVIVKRPEQEAQKDAAA
ncbi:MAG: hypothetical protein K6F35_07100 [Lachnospiraceae bacterium]|nr:hypothetical protein [Lachnospiraceae bacterium]